MNGGKNKGLILGCHSDAGGISQTGEIVIIRSVEGLKKAIHGLHPYLMVRLRQG